DPTRAHWTVRHALTMTLGTEWDESNVPYTDPTNSEIAMERAPDRYRYILDRPIVAEPGKTWIYCGGATAHLGRLSDKGTGKPLHAYAREALFDPTGIAVTEWAKGADGNESAASGLRMTPRDLARLGQLMLAGGLVDNARRIVPQAWIDLSTTPVAQVDENRQYGFH